MLTQSSEAEFFRNKIQEIKSLINSIYGGFLFFLENSRKRYRYVLLGEKHYQLTDETLLQYRMVGKRHVFEMSAKEICNMKEIIGNFHPLDVRVISFIAGVDQILAIDHDKRHLAFKNLKNNLFKYNKPS